MKGRSIAAVVYDFDGTLCPGTMQQHTLLPAIGYGNPNDFWAQVKELTRRVDGDEILTYMQHLVSVYGDFLTEAAFREHGCKLPLFEGVTEWFPRLNAFASDHDLVLEHFIVSSGLAEMIDGCPIKERFRHIFASKYAYKDGKHAGQLSQSTTPVRPNTFSASTKVF